MLLCLLLLYFTQQRAFKEKKPILGARSSIEFQIKDSPPLLIKIIANLVPQRQNLIKNIKQYSSLFAILILDIGRGN